MTRSVQVGTCPQFKLACQINSIAEPTVEHYVSLGNRYGLYWYPRQHIQIDTARCVDTVGVLLHELGHHVYHVALTSRKFNKAWIALINKEPPVSPIETNFTEAWAEAFRAFILHPKHLRKNFPLRWKFLSDRLDSPGLVV